MTREDDARETRECVLRGLVFKAKNDETGGAEVTLLSYAALYPPARAAEQ